MLSVTDLRKSFPVPGGGTARAQVINVPRFSLEDGAQVALRGESGSGKTTFLHLLAGILTPDTGSIRLGETELTALSESGRDRVRALRLSTIFQTFNLLQGHTALENVLLGMAFGPGADRSRARELLTRVGLAGKENHLPRQLSTGQQQRVAVARALANRPQVVLADEPTGNLDRSNAAEALTLIREGCRETGAALLLVSHDERALAQFEQVIDFRSINQVGKEPTS